MLRLEWIYACHKAKRQLPYNGFRLPPLAGLDICVTGLDQARRPALQSAVEGAGGKYSKHLKQGVTHLITLSANRCAQLFSTTNAVGTVTDIILFYSSDKFKVASKWTNIHIVSFSWLEDSLSSKGMPQPECAEGIE